MRSSRQQHRGGQKASYARAGMQLPDLELKGVTFGHGTEKAVMVTINGTAMWMPRSQIKAMDEKAGTLTVSGWIAKEKGLA